MGNEYSIRQSFEQVLEINLKHGYFKRNRFRTISIKPDANSQKLLKNLGMVLKPFEGGVSLLMLDPSLLRFQNEDRKPIRLYLYCNDEYHINYTHLPNYNLFHSIIYLNNIDNDSPISNNAPVGEKEAVHTSSGSVILPKLEGNAAYGFQDALGNEIPETQLKKIEKDDGVEFRFSGLDEGLIRVLVNSDVKQKIYLTPSGIWKKPFGILEVYLSELGNPALDGEMVVYDIQFDHQKTFWKYFITNPKYRKFENLDIIFGDRSDAFNALETTKVLNKEALVFESRERIPLQEGSIEQLKLVNRNENIPDVIQKLPRATPDRLFKGTNEESSDSLYSHIYV